MLDSIVQVPLCSSYDMAYCSSVCVCAHALPSCVSEFVHVCSFQYVHEYVSVCWCACVRLCSCFGTLPALRRYSLLQKHGSDSNNNTPLDKKGKSSVRGGFFYPFRPFPRGHNTRGNTMWQTYMPLGTEVVLASSCGHRIQIASIYAAWNDDLTLAISFRISTVYEHLQWVFYLARAAVCEEPEPSRSSSRPEGQETINMSYAILAGIKKK